MNKQGPGKIEWTNYTWSPVTGCKNGCSYCYANQIAQRIYPEKFEPTFRPERLKDKDIGRVPAGSRVFVVDMGDLFGSWVPDEWIEAVLKVTRENPQYVWQFLTKNPRRYDEWLTEFTHDSWLGATEDCRQIAQPRRYTMQTMCHWKGVKFLSCEPLLGKLIGPIDDLDWIIVGEENHRTHTPEEWEIIRQNADHLIFRAHANNIPVFVKNELGKHFEMREFPT